MGEYHDVEGNPISLYKLVRKEPDWAESIIKFSNEKIPALEKRITELEANSAKWEKRAKDTNNKLHMLKGILQAGKEYIDLAVAHIEAEAPGGEG